MKMYELLDSPEKWTQGTASRNKDGTPCSTDPVCWCLIGASDQCYNYDQAFEVRQKIRQELMQQEPGFITIANWNDDRHRTFEQIQSLLRKLDI